MYSIHKHKWQFDCVILHLIDFTTSTLSFQLTKPPIISSLCAKHTILTIKELGTNNTTGNPTYTPTSLSKEGIFSNHKSVISSFGLSVEDDYVYLTSL